MKIEALSEFARSAYKHALQRSSGSSIGQNISSGEYNTYCDSSRRHDDVSVAQPLSGATVIVLANNSTQSLREERESIGTTVNSLGGYFCPTVIDENSSITHAIWIDSQVELDYVSNETLQIINACLSHDIAIVNPSWIAELIDLPTGAHWSEVDLNHHIPRILKVIMNDSAQATSSRSLKSSAARHQLRMSISETFSFLVEENETEMEDQAIKRALELSLEAFALSHHSKESKSFEGESPYEILGIDEDATRAEIKAAYRRLCLLTHPDRGGKEGDFQKVSSAYRSLMSNASCLATSSQDAEKEEGKASLRSTAHWDRELQSHHDLVQALYNGLNIDENIGKQQRALDQLGLSPKDAGWRMSNEKGDELLNACFWLSLAASQLSGAQALAVWDSPNDSLSIEDRDLLLGIDAELIESTALTLKRLVEASVLSCHPEWNDRVGESVQAFSDFLVYCLQSQSVVSEWAVVVVDSCSGFVDIYKGNKFDEQVESVRRRNTITIRYIPGHYQPLLPQGPRPTLQDILHSFDSHGVVYVVTDG
mmetsp:Transcript_24107/g.54709  ORF Transcript_24107/g.54709 Transcript_24107/m.54709 type:complete len:539 (-) Transcript_24107:3252-4868(-)